MRSECCLSLVVLMLKNFSVTACGDERVRLATGCLVCAPTADPPTRPRTPTCKGMFGAVSTPRRTSIPILYYSIPTTAFPITILITILLLSSLLMFFSLLLLFYFFPLLAKLFIYFILNVFFSSN